MSDKHNIVTIDGPSGVGKSTISRKVAAALGFTYLDTGAMYRGVAYYLQELGIIFDDEARVAQSLDSLVLKLLPARDENSDVEVIVSGKDVSRQIRTPEMSMAASAVSKLGAVRSKLTSMQQEIGKHGKIVAEGRDTGTVVFPMAMYKFFLEANPEERARRRVLQLNEKGESADFDQILKLTLERDKNDSERALAPLKRAEDAIAIDTTELSIEDVSRKVLETIKARSFSA
ncbi:(d)CMP kinase [Desulfosediminicola flagellatus]|uniref:(d)CMP kinase n=1 Tax=Desulfosediminicola flagellatus TaxID=2569541 RepID=UPI0010ABB4CC|nr:(d)CMP kinase [Desulfosediminicola flagellatus]